MNKTERQNQEDLNTIPYLDWFCNSTERAAKEVVARGSKVNPSTQDLDEFVWCVRDFGRFLESTRRGLNDLVVSDIEFIGRLALLKRDFNLDKLGKMVAEEMIKMRVGSINTGTFFEDSHVMETIEKLN